MTPTQIDAWMKRSSEMECPNCHKEFVPVAGSCFRNADTYGNSVTSVAKCCGAIVRVTPVRTYRLSLEQGALEDDWGNKAKATA